MGRRPHPLTSSRKRASGAARSSGTSLAASPTSSSERSRALLQLLDLARENAALRRDLHRLRVELAIVERVLASVLHITAFTASASSPRGQDR